MKPGHTIAVTQDSAPDPAPSPSSPLAPGDVRAYVGDARLRSQATKRVSRGCWDG